jgi:hypothetical protein
MMLTRMLAAVLLLSGSGVAATIRAGTDLHVRLETKISSASSKPGDPVTAVLIVPVLEGTSVVMPPGAKLTGEIVAAKNPSKPEDRGLLELAFRRLGDTPISARVIEVDNARETVDEAGRIVGILASETLAARMEQGVRKVSERDAALGAVLGIAKEAVVGKAEGVIDYAPGVEMTVRLTAPVKWAAAVEPPQLTPVRDPDALEQLVRSLPFRTYAESPRAPSDITSLLFTATEQQLTEAFEAAGWHTAHAMSHESILETFRAIAELRGYKEAPVSVLTLGGRPPDFVFQKSNNTFAKRHHMRIWRTDQSWADKPVWVAAATHDVAIEFSQEAATFIHRIDPRIDRERAKIVSDLLLTGRVRSLALVDRPQVPRRTSNATGDDMITDGKMAVVVF